MSIPGEIPIRYLVIDNDSSCGINAEQDVATQSFHSYYASTSDNLFFPQSTSQCDQLSSGFVTYEYG